MAKISVILPCYNVEKLIDRCLTSIVNQTIGLNSLEIICVDDCSTDGTLEKLKEWEEKYTDNFLIVESLQNGRQGQARNIGMEYASSEWIGFVDSDDWLEPDYFEIMYKVADNSDYEIICCKNGRDPSDKLTLFETKSQEDQKDVIIDIKNDDDRKKLILNPVIQYSAWAKLIRKSFLVDNDLTFPVNLTYEDAFWGSLVCLYINKAYIVDRKLYHYYVNTSSTVLANNSFHHLDCITTQEMLWDEWKKRGFLDRYKDALEMECIYSSYLPGIKMLILRYEQPNYNGYLLLRYLVLKRIPDFENNPYIKANILPEKYSLIMMSLSHQLNKEQFMEMADNIKKIGL